MSEREDTLSMLREIFGPDVAREGARQARIACALEQRRSGAGQALSSCVAAYEARFGEVSPLLRDDLECLRAKSLALTRLLIEKSEDLRAFNDAFRLLTATFVEGRIAGAAQVLRVLLERRFGQLDPLHVLAIQIADATDLNGCLGRLDGARSALDVVGALLPGNDGGA